MASDVVVLVKSAQTPTVIIAPAPTPAPVIATTLPTSIVVTQGVGAQGPPGTGGGNATPIQYIGQTAPTGVTTNYTWWETYPDGTLKTLWVETGFVS